MPLARRPAIAAVLLGVVIWATARPLPVFFSIDDAGVWAFNPFAWQLMFVPGIVSRVHPLSEGFHTSTPARWLVHADLVAVLAFAVVKLFVLTQPLPGTLKQNLSVDRVINFLAIAWLTTRLVRLGSVAWVAPRLPDWSGDNSRTAVSSARCG